MSKQQTAAKLLFLYFIVGLVLSLTCEPVKACGASSCFNRTEGRASNEPLRFKQRIPDLRERSKNASGPYKGAVHRESTQFKELVRNNNTLIEFKDQERFDSSSRLMTKRCKEMLDRLAEAVKTRWGSEGVKLRVIKAYDAHKCSGEGIHGSRSLHHEARAVDFVTSDEDKTKYPELGRMAYNVGFDWVMYARYGYIHASVMSQAQFGEENWNCDYYKMCMEPFQGKKNYIRPRECSFG